MVEQTRNVSVKVRGTDGGFLGAFRCRPMVAMDAHGLKTTLHCGLSEPMTTLASPPPDRCHREYSEFKPCLECDHSRRAVAA